MLAPDGSDDEDSAYRVRDSGLISGSGRSPGEGNGYPLKYFLPVEFHGQRSLMSYRPWGHKETNMTEWLTLSFHGVQRGVIPFLPISLKLQDWDIAWPKIHSKVTSFLLHCYHFQLSFLPFFVPATPEKLILLEHLHTCLPQDLFTVCSAWIFLNVFLYSSLM